MNIPNVVIDLYKAFKKEGKKLYVVGGAVRDFIQNKIPKDIDLSTDALPEEVVEIATKYGFKVNVTSAIRYGTVHVEGLEITTFREDIGTNRKLQAVQYSNLQNDANRRDLTINALYYDPVKREIIDPVGGAKDLKDKRIKAVGVPEQRFEEDQVRKMRAVRFFVSMGGTWDPNTYDALKANPDISKVSKIGIFNELEKGIQKTRNVIEYLTLLDNLGFLTQIFPNLAITKPFINEKDITVLIAYLLKNNPEKTLETALKQELKYSKDLTRDIVFLISLANFDVQKIVQYKKTQSIVDLKPSQIQRFGQHIGVNFTRFLKFKLSVKNPEELKLKGEDIKNWILQKEIENYNSINEIAASIFSKINNYFILR